MGKVFVLTLIIFNVMGGACFAEALNKKVNMISGLVAHNKYQRNNAILLDVMPPSDYEKFHAVGSINLPNDGPGDIQKIREMELPFSKSDEIIVYCS